MRRHGACLTSLRCGVAEEDLSSLGECPGIPFWPFFFGFFFFVLLGQYDGEWMLEGGGVMKLDIAENYSLKPYRGRRTKGSFELPEWNQSHRLASDLVDTSFLVFLPSKFQPRSYLGDTVYNSKSGGEAHLNRYYRWLAMTFTGWFCYLLKCYLRNTRIWDEKIQRFLREDITFLFCMR